MSKEKETIINAFRQYLQHILINKVKIKSNKNESKVVETRLKNGQIEASQDLHMCITMLRKGGIEKKKLVF